MSQNHDPLPATGDGRGDATSAPVGRPTKFTPDVRAAVLLLLVVGNFRQTAARRAGVDPATLRRWMQIGRDDLRAGRDTEHARFHADVQEAEAKGETSLVDAARSVAVEDRNPAMLQFLLTRKYPHWNDKLMRKLSDIERRVRAVEGGKAMPDAG